MAKSGSITAPAAREVRVAWDRAIDDLRGVEEEYARVNPQHTAAFEAAEADCPRESEFFSRYNLGCYEDEGKGRVRNFRAARIALVTERCRELGRLLTDTEAQEAAAEAERVVSEFDAWAKRRDEAHERHQCDMWETRFDALVDKRWAAQQAVINAEAPDLNAMLVKLELLASVMDGEVDQARVAAIRDDARRLLAA
jgi:hypothetical protein